MCVLLLNKAAGTVRLAEQQRNVTARADESIYCNGFVLALRSTDVRCCVYRPL